MIYVGDEVRDIEASQSARVASIAVTWGFNSRDILSEAKPSFLAHSPSDLHEFLSPMIAPVVAN